MRSSRIPGPDGGPVVYPPREDTELLASFAADMAGLRVLEIGVGSGTVALRARAAGARVVATDLNPHALRATQRRAASAALSLGLVRTDLARGLGAFDRVLCNPPYLPTRPEERDPDRWVELALDGGPDGCATTARLIDGLAAHLRPGGAGFVLESSLQDADRLAGLRRRWERDVGPVTEVGRRELEGERLTVRRWGRDR